MTPPPLFLLSGLGADERLFQFLQLQHPNPVVIQWIAPLPNESLGAYAGRLLAQLGPIAEPPVLVGLSFGGMVAQELARRIPVRRVILLSSLANTGDLPWYYRAGGFLRLQHLVPFQLAKRWTAPTAWLFGAQTPAEKKILAAIVRDTDPAFLRWALTAILRWRHTAPVPNRVIIHGDRDKILPVPHQAGVHVVQGGEHLMVMSRAAEVSALLNRYLH
ncbi:alpha/beta fold hydrolase [Rufibacter psychrotolerans]|uniref:alpha/beta fold hydrolase n=1 Tax=Rufibacter psychrotolerans TaxID=2812556 RepID=UPI0019688D99|nr:alpha/beta hydrolase [Rufibacter sp. SYSU D00308]